VAAGGAALRLLPTRRLGPLFWALFAGAVNDNLLKNAYVILVAYREAQSGRATETIVTIATAVFILPYFLFSALAGEVADKYEKSWLLRQTKLAEIGVVTLGALSLLGDNIWFQLGVLFLLGVQATVFGPVKYAVLPELMPETELLAANALVDAGTFLAILIGTIAGGLLILAPAGRITTGAALLALALFGYGASWFIPATRDAQPAVRLRANIAASTWEVAAQARARPEVWRAVLGISWFWFVGAAVISQFPNYAKEYLAADNQVVTLFLALNSIGVGVGSLAANRILRGEISARLVPWSALAMAAFTFELWLASPAAQSGVAMSGAVAFLGIARHWRIIGDLVGVALAAGVFVVPLYAIMQARSDETERARVVAANNILNAVFIVVAGAGSAVMLRFGSGVPAIFLVLGVANAALAAALILRRRALLRPRPRPR
jgi:acyl-[acyl-carrier-protein]-phospholipid O-acyltransferase / long-chain-fatty-acid--[acyl-carrier-protein] ligase